MQSPPTPLVHRQTFTIRSYDVDFRRQLRPDVLCSYFQEAASEHALRLGVGYRQLEEKGMFWVLSRLLLEVERMPVWHEEITIETWAKGTDRLFALRDFLVYNADGEILCRATSYWLILQMDSRRPLRPDQFFNRLKHEEDAVQTIVDKLSSASQEAEVNKLQVHYADLDHNRHVNNLRYIAWMFNCFDLAFFEQHQLRKMQINFLSEVREGEQIAICREQTGNGQYLLSGYQEDRKEPCFSGYLQWLFIQV
ncbi:MAG: acyl-[acyl-carrier-protein] thioesterase [Cyclobacteriaceae bacterium]